MYLFGGICKNPQIEFNRYFTHSDLANMIGVARTTVSELMGQLRQAGVVSGGPRRLIVYRRAAERYLQAAAPPPDK